MSIDYRFPVINNISDVLPHIDNNFRVADKSGLTFISYNHIAPDVFPTVTDLGTSIRRECRGIAFNTKTGDIVSRPFHKFFNVGERDDIELPDSIPYIEEKLDGSMLRPLLMPDKSIRWGTKMGITDVSMQAEVFIAANPQYDEFARIEIDSGRTPIFEFTSPNNRIVLEYSEPSLTLLAVRDNSSGVYLGMNRMSELFPSIPVIGAGLSMKEVRESTDAEGIVLVYPNGHRLKVKSDWYVKAHRAKGLLENERRLVKAIINDELDDVLPTLLPKDKKIVEDKITSFWAYIEERGSSMDWVYGGIRQAYRTKKDFAVDTSQTNYIDRLRPLIFSVWDGKAGNMGEALLNQVKRSTGSAKGYEKMKSDFKLRLWEPKLMWEKSND